jgi:hypothetical protein
MVMAWSDAQTRVKMIQTLALKSFLPQQQGPASAHSADRCDIKIDASLCLQDLYLSPYPSKNPFRK